MTQLMIDVTGGSLPGLLSALGGNYPDVLAGYVTGSPDIDWHAAYWSELAGHVGLFRYDQSPGLSLFTSGAADGADCETGAAGIEHAVSAAAEREKRGWWSWLYFSMFAPDGHSQLDEARARKHDAGLSKLQFIVADWDMNLSEAIAFLAAHADVNAVQWASPTSNPATICPGTSRTLAELNVDLNVTTAGWFRKTAPPPPPRLVTGAEVFFADGTTVRYGATS